MEISQTSSQGQQSYLPIQVFFGSQTGTADDFGRVLVREGKKEGFDIKKVDLEKFNADTLTNVPVAIFLMATTGEGDPTDNAVKFNGWLTSSQREPDTLKHLKFTVFGLGNKKYDNYNAQGKRTNQHLERIGADRIYKYGEGDDLGDIEEDFNEWKADLWKQLKEKLAVQQAPVVNEKILQLQSNLPFSLKINQNKEEIDVQNYHAQDDGKEYEFQMKQYLSSSNVKITAIKELRQKIEDGSTLHIELDIGSAGIPYKTAANLAIFPENRPEIVEKTAKHLGLNLSDIISIEENADKKSKFKYPFPTPISVQTYLTKFCDLSGAVRKKQLTELAEFCPTEDLKKKMLLLSSAEGKSQFENEISSQMKGLGDLLEEFNIKLPLENLINIASLIPPRFYTIASSSLKNPKSLHICASLEIKALANGQSRMGLTSSFFQRIQKNHLAGQSLPSVKVSVRESTFHLPTVETPAIMIGPGAGLAPFRGFVEERAFLNEKGEKNVWGQMMLYFGCKGRDWDYLYREELIGYHEGKVIDDLFVAFSREQDKKVYVQDLLLENKEKVMSLLFEKNATIYICGSMRMGKDVLNVLTEISAIYHKLDLQEAAKKVEELEKAKRIIKEIWG